MSSPPSEPAPGTRPDSADPAEPKTRPAPRPAGVRNALRARMNPSERSYWQLVPRRNFRLAVLLLILIVAVVVMKRSGALSMSRMFDQLAPAVPAPKSSGTFQHLEFKPAPTKRP